MAWFKKFAKPEFFEELERWFDPSDPELLRERYDDAIASLDAEDPDAWMTPAAGIGVPTDDREHFDNHWLGNDQAYWPSIEPDQMLSKMRTAFGAAMRDARAYGLPIDYVWVSPEGFEQDHFDVGHVVGPNSVTAVIVTSMPPNAESPA